MKIEKHHIIILMITGTALIILGWEIYMFATHYPPAGLQPTISSRKLNTVKHKDHYTQHTTSPMTTYHLTLIPQQKEYIDLVNKIQIAKMELRLINQKLAIVTARYNIALLETRTQELTKKHNEHYKCKREDSLSNTNTCPYQLLYLDHQNENWTATLLSHGNHIEVKSGSLLDDNMQVISINHQGILLKSRGNYYRLSFNGMKRITNDLHAKASKLDTPKITIDSSIAQKKPINVSIPQMIINHNINLDTYTFDEISLLNLPFDNYTIMLRGSFNKNDLVTFAQKNNLGPKAIYYSIQKQQRPWFILLYGHYNTKLEAMNALQQLSKPLTQTRSEVRRINAIQHAIKSKTPNLNSDTN